MSAQPTDETASAYSRVYSATSSVELTAKSIASATGLPYGTVTENLGKLEEEGLVTKAKDGSRTMWTRTDGAAPDAPAEPAADDNTVVIPGAVVVDAAPAADVEAAHVASATDERIAAIIAGLHGAPVDALKKDALMVLCNDMGIPTRKSQTRASLVELASQRIADYRQAQIDAARPDYASMTVKELRAAAKDLNVQGALSKMPRADLVVACNSAYDLNAMDEADEATQAETPAATAESAPERSNVVEGPWGTPDASTAPTGSLDAVLADLQSARPVSAPPAQVTRTRSRSAGGNTGVYRPAGGVVTSGMARAWTRGECERTLLGMLQAAPDVEHSATTLVKAWNAGRAADAPVMQPGSTAFALDAMVKKGTARQTQAKPKRYAAQAVPITA